MAAAAETIPKQATAVDWAQWESQFETPDQLTQPEGSVCIKEAADFGVESLARSRATQLIGRAAVGGAAEIEYTRQTDETSLMEAIHRAREGDPIARRMVEANVRSDAIERTIKAGHVMKKVKLEVNGRGQVLQYGQTAESIQINSLRYASQAPQIRERTEPEVRNMYRIEELRRRGVLKDYVFVVFSRAADTMSIDAMRAEGFFTDTMSMAIQATTEENDGSLTTEPAFVAGKRDRDGARHDAESLARLGDNIGMDYRGKSAAQVIDMPALVHKKYMPNGVIDVVAWLDAAAGGTFFGQGVPQQDYLQYLTQCAQREAELESTVQVIADQLIREAESITTHVGATSRLSKLSEEKLLHRALTDEKIDGLVFGEPAAFYLAGARYYLEAGDTDKANELFELALETASSSSCPGVGKESGISGSSEDSESGEQRNDSDCIYTSKECPMCKKKNVVTWDRQISGKHRRISGISGGCNCTKDYIKK